MSLRSEATCTLLGILCKPQRLTLHLHGTFTKFKSIKFQKVTDDNNGSNPHKFDELVCFEESAENIEKLKRILALKLERNSWGKRDGSQPLAACFT